MMKRFKSKRKISFKLLFLLIIISIILLANIIHKNMPYFENKELINYLFSNINPYMKIDNDFSNKMVNKILNLDDLFYSKTYQNKTTYEKTNNVFAMTNSPRVYIYNTHDTEAYLDGILGVREAAKLLKLELEKVNISTLVEENRVSTFYNKLYRTSEEAYDISRKYLVNVLKTYPNLELIIDLHRDAVNRANSYVSIDNKDYAKILFVQSIRYDTYEKNMQLVNSINDKVKAKYPNLSRGIMIKKQTIFNQDLNTNIILLELGSNNNSFEEVNNTIDILVPIIKEVLDEKKGI